jgi:hypothetical protein
MQRVLEKGSRMTVTIKIKNVAEVKRMLEETRLKLANQFSVPYEHLYPNAKIIDLTARDILPELPAGGEEPPKEVDR